MPKVHRYNPLNKTRKGIRLLELTALGPGREYGYDGDCVFARFHYRFLANSDHEVGNNTEILKYMTLSYVWGTPNYTSAVILEDGSYIPITSNLLVTLQHVFAHNFAPGGCPIWVDAVCIDQSNLDEKSWQVAQMGQIYASAARTFVFLGAASQGSDEGMRLLEGVGEKAIKLGFLESTSKYNNIYLGIEYAVGTLCGHDDRTKSHQQAPVLQQFLNSIVIPGGEGPRGNGRHGELLTRLQSVHSIMNRPWWRRVWVVQELLLSTSPIIICGGQIAGPHNMIVALSIIDIFHTCLYRAVDPSTSSNAIPDLLKSIAPLHQTSPVVSLYLDQLNHQYKRASSSTMSATLFRFLERINGTSTQAEASNPRDYIYALLGLVTHWPAPGTPIQPDYSKPTADVYIETAISLVAGGYGIILHMAGLCRKGVLDLPSWVPDWSIARETQRFGDMITRPPGTYSLVDGRHVLEIEGIWYGAIKISASSVKIENLNPNLFEFGDLPLHFTVQEDLTLQGLAAKEAQDGDIVVQHDLDLGYVLVLRPVNEGYYYLVGLACLIKPEESEGDDRRVFRLC